MPLVNGKEPKKKKKPSNHKSLPMVEFLQKIRGKLVGKEKTKAPVPAPKPAKPAETPGAFKEKQESLKELLKETGGNATQSFLRKKKKKRA